MNELFIMYVFAMCYVWLIRDMLFHFTSLFYEHLICHPPLIFDTPFRGILPLYPWMIPEILEIYRFLPEILEFTFFYAKLMENLKFAEVCVLQEILKFPV